MSDYECSAISGDTPSTSDEETQEENQGNEVSFTKLHQLMQNLLQQSCQLSDLQWGVMQISNNLQNLQKNIDQCLVGTNIWYLQLEEQHRAIERLEVEYNSLLSQFETSVIESKKYDF